MNIPVRAIFQTILNIAWILLVAPWVTIAGVMAAIRRIEASIRRLLALRFAFATHLPCPRGHRSELRGVFECRTCGSLFAGWAFGPCPTCATSCGYVACERCGLAVRNPMV